MKIRYWILGITAIVILIIAGALLDWKGFLVNLIASAIVVIISITVINQIVMQRRRNQWKRVRSQIISAILNHFGNIIGEYETNVHLDKDYYLMGYVEETGIGYDEPENKTAIALQRMAEKMRTLPKPENSREQSEQLHEIIKWDIEQIRSVLLPRILAMETEEPELVSLLSALDNADRYWVNQYIMDKEISSGEQFEAASEFLKSMADVYEYILKNPL
jgi:hypothetical protein